MSGGAFNYLCWADSSTIFNKLNDLREMIDYVEGYEMLDVAKELTEYFDFLTSTLDAISEKHSHLQDLMKSIEWAASGDSNIGDVKEEFTKYQSEKNATTL